MSLSNLLSRFTRFAMLPAFCALIYSCAPTIFPQRPPENYKGPLAEGPILQADDYWIYRRPDGTRAKAGSGTLLAPIEFPLWIGRVWSYRSEATPSGQPRTSPHRAPVEVQCEATSFSRTRVAAGAFDAFYCKCQCEVIGSGIYEKDCGVWSLWYAPQVKNIIKIVTPSTDSSFELMEYQILSATAPSTYYDFIESATAHMRKGAIDSAIQDFDQAIRLNPDQSDGYLRRGVAYSAKNDLDRAMQNFDDAVRLNPKDAGAFYLRGMLYGAKGEYPRAIADIDQMIKLNARDANALLARGKFRSLQGDYDLALADYQRASKMNPKVPWESPMGLLLFFMDRVKEGAAVMGQAVKAAPDDGYVRLWRYILQTKIGDAANARRELGDHAAKLKERAWPEAVIEFYLGNITEADLYVAAETPSEKKDVQLCDANFYAAELKLLTGSVNEAVPLLKSAEKGCPVGSHQKQAAAVELKRLGY